MGEPDEEDQLLRSVALQNAQSILIARQRVEQELLLAKEALERKTAELAHSLARLRATLESTTDGILVTDVFGTVTDFNQRYVEIWGLPYELMAPTEHHRMLATNSRRFKDPQQFLTRIEQIYASSPLESLDLLELADGKVFRRFSKIQFVDHENAGRVWSFRDITHYIRADEALKDETRILELLNKTGTTLASNLDLRTLVQAVTDAATQVSGAQYGAFFYNTEDEKDATFKLYTLSGARQEALEKFGHPRITPLFAPTFQGEHPIRCEDVFTDTRYGKLEPHHGMPPGHLPVRSYLAVPVISRSAEVIGGLLFGHPEPGIFTERTERLIVGVAAQAAVAIDNARLYAAAQNAAEERKLLLDSERAARAQVEKANEMKDEFLANLSHELQTPLSAILGWSQFLKISPLDPEDFQRGLEAIERSANLQAQLIAELLEMSRITSGKLSLDLETVEPILLIEAAIEMIKPGADAKAIKIIRVLDPAAGPVTGDPSRLQQIMWHLLSNAIKFTPEAGQVQVRLERVNTHIEITVTDNGIGIKPEFLAHVFERFRQQDATATRSFGGLGLGLSLVKHLVELHGGTVHVRSAGEHQGTIFAVHLPLIENPG